jgi:hypothetical protein
VDGILRMVVRWITRGGVCDKTKTLELHQIQLHTVGLVRRSRRPYKYQSSTAFPAYVITKEDGMVTPTSNPLCGLGKVLHDTTASKCNEIAQASWLLPAQTDYLGLLFAQIPNSRSSSMSFRPVCAGPSPSQRTSPPTMMIRPPGQWVGRCSPALYPMATVLCAFTKCLPWQN